MKKSERVLSVSSSLVNVFQNLLDDYILSLEALNRSPRTTSWYQEILKRYFNFLISNSLLKSVDQLGTHELRTYILHLQQSTRWSNCPNIKKATGNLSPYSIQGHVRAIKAFWSWLKREGYIGNNPLAGFPLPKVPQKPFKVLSSEHITSLLANIDRLTPKGAMYYAIFMLLLDTGIRISELINITMQDLNLQHNLVEVIGKGQKIRTVPFSNITKKEISRYINHCRPQACSIESPYLFPSSDGTAISVNSTQQFLRRLARKAGLDGIKCSPHVFRHTFATQSVANGANVFVLRDIMGHSSLVTTMKYTHLQPHDLRRQHEQFSPVKNLTLERNR